MSYEPATKVDSGIFFGAYHSTSQSLPSYSGSSFFTTWYWFSFDTAIGNATSDSNDNIKLNDKTRAYIVGDIYNTNQSGQSGLNVWTYGLTYNLSNETRFHVYNKTSMHDRNTYGRGPDHFDGFVEYDAEVAMHGVLNRGTTINIPGHNFLAGVYV